MKLAVLCVGLTILSLSGQSAARANSGDPLRIPRRISEINAADPTSSNGLRTVQIILASGSHYQKVLALRSLAANGLLQSREVTTLMEKEQDGRVKSLYKILAITIAPDQRGPSARNEQLVLLMKSQEPSLAHAAGLEFLRANSGKMDSIHDRDTIAKLNHVLGHSAYGKYWQVRSGMPARDEEAIDHLIQELGKLQHNSPGQPMKAQALILALAEFGNEAVNPLLRHAEAVMLRPQDIETYFQRLYLIDALKSIGDERAIPFLQKLTTEQWKLSAEMMKEIAVHRAGRFVIKEVAQDAIGWISSGVRYPILDEVLGWYMTTLEMEDE